MNIEKAKAVCRSLPGATEDIRSYGLVLRKLTKKLQREIETVSETGSGGAR